MIVASGAATNALIGFAAAGGREARIVPARRDRAHWRAIEQRLATGAADGPPDSLDRALALLSRTRPRSCRRGRSSSSSPTSCRPRRVAAARRARGGLGRDSGRRPGSRVGAIVPGRLRRHAAARRPRRPHVVARPPQPQGGTRPPRAQRAARRRARPHAARSSELDPVHDHEQRPRRRARRVSGVGGRAATRGREAAVSEAGRRRWAAAAQLRRSPACWRSRLIARRGDRGGARRRPRRPAELHRAPARPARSPSSARSRASAALFGDPVEAEIDVYTSDASVPRRVGPRRDELRAVPASRRPGSTGEHAGGVSLLRTRITLQCLTRACLPPRGGARVVRFRPFAVTYRRRRAAVTAARALGAASGLLAAPARATAGVGIVDTAPPLEPAVRPVARDVRALSAPRRAACSACAGAALVRHGAVAAVAPRAAPLGGAVPARALAAAGRGRRRDDDEAAAAAHARPSWRLRLGEAPGSGARAADAGARLGRERHPSPRRLDAPRGSRCGSTLNGGVRG